MGTDLISAIMYDRLSIELHAFWQIERTECDLDIQTELLQYTDHPGVGFPK